MADIEKLLDSVSDVIDAAAGNEKHKRTGAVIVAAGSSSRMNGVDKQFVELNGMPVLAHTVRAFENAGCIDEIVIVTKKEKITAVIEMCEKYGFSKVTSVVPGGETRQISAWLGFSELPDKTRFAAIHDGARCLVTPEMIENVCRAAYIYGAATAATRSTDTVKRTEKGGFIAETLNREHIWLAQTPQVFGCNLYRAAGYTADTAGFLATDDCSMAERIEYKAIRLVECGRENIKITTPDDLFFAEAILDARERKKDSQRA